MVEGWRAYSVWHRGAAYVSGRKVSSKRLRYISPTSPLHLPYISPVSPVYLPYISPISRLAFLSKDARGISLYLPHISRMSPVYLPYISPM